MVRKVCWAPCFILFLNIVAFGQFGGQGRQQRAEYSIRGKLMFSNGQDVDQRVEVRLEGAVSQLVSQSYTDSIGNFEFRNLQPGSYYVVVSGDGFETARQQVEVFGTGGGVTNVTVFLEPTDGARRGALRGVDAADPDIIDVSQMKENFPKKAVQNYDKAADEIKKGRETNAIKLLEEAIKVAPKFFRAHLDLGLLYQKARRFLDAEREYKVSQELSAKNV